MNTAVKRTIVALSLGLSVFGLTACATRPIDMNVTQATQVPGIPNLYWMCFPEDPGTALYFSNVPGTSENDFEFAIYDHDGCLAKLSGAAPAPTAPSVYDRNSRQEFTDEFGSEDK